MGLAVVVGEDQLPAVDAELVGYVKGGGAPGDGAEDAVEFHPVGAVDGAGVAALTEAARNDGAVLLTDVIARVLAAGWTDEQEIRRVCEGGEARWT